MMLEFDKLDAQVVPHFKGGQGEAHVRTAVQDGMGRILTLTLPVLKQFCAVPPSRSPVTPPTKSAPLTLPVL